MRYVKDPLLMFSLIAMMAAQTITAHGTYVFYSYMLPVQLAAAATVVLAVGVPLLEFAGVLDPERKVFYFFGMGFLLLLEGLAQYFQGQAGFVARIRDSFAVRDGVDLVTIAEAPGGRTLPILFLAALSAVVVGFGWVSANRIKLLYSQAEHDRETTATENKAIAQLREALAKAAEEIRELRDKLAGAGTTESALAQQLRETRETAREKIAGMAAEIARLSKQPATVAPTRDAVIAYCREQMHHGAKLQPLSRELGFSEATLRGWLASVATGSSNGHLVEEDRP